VDPGNLARKLLTMRPKLLLNMKQFLASPERKSSNQLDIDMLCFASLREAYESFYEGLKALTDQVLLKQLSKNITEQYEMCAKAFKQCELRFDRHSGELLSLDCEEDEVEPTDSTSQVSKQRSVMSSSSAVMRRIELERK